MKTYKSPLGKIKGGLLLMTALSSVMLSHVTQANTSAGTVLRNSVTVDYEDVDNNAQPQETASVDVTVDLVASVAWGTAPSDQTVSTSGGSLPSAYEITLTNTGNGSDTYDITDNTAASGTCTTGTLGSESFGFSASETLGATVSSGAGVFSSPNTTIPVSNLVAADFANNDRVIINGNPYVVVSATENGDATVPDTLVVVGDASTDVAIAGVQIGEQIDFSYGGSGAAGTLSAGATGCEHEHELVADGTLALGGTNNPQASDTVNGWSTFVNGVQLTVVKYVRNVDDSDKNPLSSDITYDSVEYYASGVTGNPDDVLEYLVVITNSSAGDAQNVVFNDTLPTFTTYEPATLAVDTNGDETFNHTNGSTVGLGVEDETAADGGIIVISGSAITVYPGAGGDETAPDGGTVQDVGQAAGDPANKTAIKYQVTID